jgi:uncharacterized SAM-binding protein YcdF (DUF218 family)
MIRRLQQAILLGFALLALTLLSVAAHALWLAHLAGPPKEAGVIVVLAGATEPDGTLAPETVRRTETGVALHKAGIAPRIHFTGGVETPERAGAGDRMRELAISLGVPPQAATAESRSRSTLQNALMSREVLGPLTDGPVVLVSGGYHLARAWASFRWAGYGPPVRLAASSAFGGDAAVAQAKRLVREVAAWWYNIARVLAWHLAGLAGIGEAARMPMLA